MHQNKNLKLCQREITLVEERTFHYLYANAQVHIKIPYKRA